MSVSKLLRIINLQYLTVIILLIFTFFFNTESSIIHHSLIEYYLLCVVLIFLLTINKFFKNKLFEIFISFFLCFFLLRFSILLCFSPENYSGFSTLISERNLKVDEVRNSLKNLKYLVLSLFISLIIFNTDIERCERIKNKIYQKNFIIQLTLFILFSSFIYNLFLHDNAEKLNFIFQIFFNVFNWVTMTPIIILTYLTYHTSKIDFINKIYISMAIILYLAAIIPSGSKAGMLYIILFFYLIYYMFDFNEQKIVRNTLLIFPLIIFLILLFWAIGILITEISQFNDSNYYINSEKVIEEVYFQGHKIIIYEKEHFIIHLIKKKYLNFQLILDSLIYRIGYLDFYLDKSIFEGYKEYINLNYYFKSFIDKITPGFDVYGVPLASRALYYAYFGTFTSITQSEQMTMFAESVVLFKNYYFLYYFFLSIFLKILFFINKNIFKDIFLKNLSNLYLVIFYFYFLTGYGLDTHLMELFYFYVIILNFGIFLIILNKFFYK